MTALTGAVLAVGDELLLGDVVNGNAAWLGGALAAVGVQVVHSACVGDDPVRLGVALRRAVADTDVVVLTGGLGPTIDDRTREALAAVAGVPLERRPELVDVLRLRVDALGQDLDALPAAVLSQADLPRGATPLRNPVGTAPGIRLDLDGTLVFALPGPPHEMRAVAQEHLLGELSARTGVRYTTRTLHCAGVGEATAAQRVEAAVQVPAEVALSYLVADGLVRVRFSTARDPAVLEPLVAAAARALGEDVWGQDDDSQAAVVGALLRAAGQTLATAESLTGGLVAGTLTGAPGISSVFRGGLVVYATDTKHGLAGVDAEVLAAHGAVSAATALALAEGARAVLGADWGIATTGVAGPDPQEGKPVGTVHVAVAGPAGTRHVALRLPGDRERVRVRTVSAVLDLLRRELQAARRAGTP
ncbi:MAG: Competence-inducible (CinA-like) protein [Frankiales bacterium]|nr:Competence-inducible (CinA-like) protein [Frankiales bacterium]